MCTCTLSPAATGTIGPNAPDSTSSPARKGSPRAAIVRASQYAARSGWPRQAAPLPLDSTRPFTASCMSSALCASWPMLTGRWPSTYRPDDALSATVSTSVMRQSAMALSTISPDLNEQFSALVNLAVVTNVVPYVIALSALWVMMRDAKVESGTRRLNTFVAVVAIVYSIYAIYASGKDAVMGGMLVMAVGYLIWGLIAPRFPGGAQSRAS